MTRLPSEPKDITAKNGEMFPPYKVRAMCAHPECSKFVDHSHHIVRRSFIGGDVPWVQFGNGDIVGNLCGLCWKHHEDITQNRSRIIYEERLHRYEWCDLSQVGWVATGALYPAPPRHGQPLDHTHGGEPKIYGPGSSHICPECKRAIPQKMEKTEGEPAKRRKSWNVKVPDDTEEDGALVLDTLLEECASIFGRDMSQVNLRYYVLAQALALVVQHKDHLS